LDQKNALFEEIIRDAYVDEKIYVDIELKNPLKISLNLKDICLICEYEEKITEINLLNIENEVEEEKE